MIKSWDDYLDAVSALPRYAQHFARATFDLEVLRQRQAQCPPKRRLLRLVDGSQAAKETK